MRFDKSRLGLLWMNLAARNVAYATVLRAQFINRAKLDGLQRQVATQTGSSPFASKINAHVALLDILAGLLLLRGAP